MITFITLAIIGWVISFSVAIWGMMTSWNNKNKSGFYSSLGLFVISIPFGLIIGWAMVVSFIKDIVVDKHFDNDDGPKQVKG
jgi:hypothetical protein